MVPWTLLPATEVDVNIEKCVLGNKDLFMEAWAPWWNKMADMGEGDVVPNHLNKHAVQKLTSAGAKSFSTLAISMMDSQLAMARCGFSAQQEAIIMDSMETGQPIGVKLAGFDKDASASQLQDSLSDALEAWKDRDFTTFGKRLGVAMRDVMVDTFPEKYYVDSDGALRHHLIQLADGAADDAKASVNPQLLALASVLAAGAFGLLTLLVIVRSRRALVSPPYLLASTAAAEALADEEGVNAAV